MTPAAQRGVHVGAASLGYVYIGLFVVGFALTGFIAPPSPGDSPAEVAAMFKDDTTLIRIGLLIATAGAALSLPLQAVVATQVRRIEGRYGALSLIWVMGAALFTLELVYPLMFWLVTAFRPDTNPALLQKFNDLSWLTFLGVVSTAIVQVLALAVAILLDDAQRPVYPRWFGYASIWAALSFIPAGLIVFFKDGPFAWNGLIAWWLALSAFALWTDRAHRARRRNRVTPRLAQQGRTGDLLMKDTTAEWASDIDYSVVKAFLWSGIAVVVSVLVAGGLLMHYIPPPSPATSPEEFLQFVRAHRSGIIAGGAVAVVFWSFWTTWPVPAIVLIRRMERKPLLTYASIALLGSTSAIITLIAVAWSIMAFRAEDAQIVQAFNDLAFYLFLYTWPPFGLWMVIIAVAIFRDVNRESIFPRWVAYYNIYCAMLMAPATLIGAFKTGPFTRKRRLIADWIGAPAHAGRQ